MWLINKCFQNPFAIFYTVSNRPDYVYRERTAFVIRSSLVRGLYDDEIHIKDGTGWTCVLVV